MPGQRTEFQVEVRFLRASEEVGITRVIPHEDYSSNTLENDICLLQLSEPLFLGE